ncbi:MAG TPA: metallophosphoesterase [Clostridia bacterium]|nr:metallophosphoesterase [Clostridia bacterium]
MKAKRISRRRWLLGTALAAPLLAVADAKLLEPEWIRVRRLRIGTGQPAHRLVHITDIHHKGDHEFLRRMVNKINALSPDFVCFTGDLIEEEEHLEEAQKILAEIKSPLFGVPGNHDYWAKIKFDGLVRCCAATGGAWLMDQDIVTCNGKITILGAACLSSKQPPLRQRPGTRNIFLMHYPAWVHKLEGQRFDLLLAGHSHGGQVRIPFIGPVITPFGVEKYDMGLFETPSGPLYVNPGIGWFAVPIRFNCRPEITVVEL